MRPQPQSNHPQRCHAPRRRGIQYAAAHWTNHNRLGVLDRAMTPRMWRQSSATPQPPQSGCSPVPLPAAPSPRPPA
ncbi:hypothetical protein C7G41_12040 [Bradyrhizobium sp. MOS002]|nr:hypothetical protein C7G41_12040 [Bradyrhizobium sp. MOS002]